MPSNPDRDIGPVARQLLDMDRAADALSISRPTIYGFVQSGDLQTVTIGRRRFTTPAMIDAFIQKLAAHGDNPLPSEVPNGRWRPNTKRPTAKAVTP